MCLFRLLRLLTRDWLANRQINEQTDAEGGTVGEVEVAMLLLSM